MGLEGHADAAKGGQAVEEFWIESKAEVGERTKLGWVVGVCGCEHSGGGGRGFGERGTSVEDGDTEAAAMEFEGEREADNAGASDTDVGVLHRFSLVALGEVIVWCIRLKAGVGFAISGNV